MSLILSLIVLSTAFLILLTILLLVNFADYAIESLINFVKK